MPKAASREEEEASASDAGRRYPLNIRTTKEMREKLGAAARRSGRSLTQEMEFRLEQSFGEVEVIERLFGGPAAVAFLTTVGSAIRLAQLYARRRNLSEEETRRIVRQSTASQQLTCGRKPMK
jgi:hypothetical protein